MAFDRRIHQADMTEHEGATELGHEFLEGVGGVAEALAELSSQAIRVAGPVHRFMQVVAQ